MRKILIPLLMASAVIPAAAMAQDRDRSGDRRSERSEQRRETRPEREARQERSRPAAETQRSLPSQASGTARERSFGHRGDVQRSDRAAEVQVHRNDDGDRRGTRRAPTPGLDGLVGERNATEVQRRIDSGTTTTTRDGRNGGFDTLRDVTIRDGRVVDNHRDDRRGHDRHGDWRRDGNGNWHNGDHRDWRRDWRNDHRYDWRRYRDRNRIVFRLGNYYDPYRYNYRRFNIGYTLWPNYYSSRYWLNDPWQYRLPPAYGPYRWVRYYDDALLVNIYTGQVVDVIYHFFW